MTEVQGHCDERFEAVREAFAANAAEEVGASVAITVDGDYAVDLWAGWADAERTTPWQRDTVVNTWSTTKTMLALCAHVLADRGQLDLDAPVASYWPEFAANGKERVLVRHLLSHASGVSGLDQPARPEELYDWDSTTARLASQAPWWEPGTTSGYHAIVQGFLVGEVIRRVDGRKPAAFFAEEIAAPLGADFAIGLSADQAGRVCDVLKPPRPEPPGEIDMDSPAVKTFLGPMIHARMANSPEWRAADLAAANGHGNARSVARVQSVVACGGEVDGVRLLSPESVDRVFEEQTSGTDLVLGIPLRFAMGYALPDPVTFGYLPQGRVCVWGGWGGSLVIADADRRMCVAYVMNKMKAGMLGSPQSEALVKAAYASLR